MSATPPSRSPDDDAPPGGAGSPSGPPPPADAPPPQEGISRRAALTRLAVAGAAALGVTGGALLLHDRKRPGSDSARHGKPRDYRRPEPPEGPELVFARQASPTPAQVAELCRKLIDALGGMGRFVGRGERVVIKPNVGWDRNEQQAANTNPHLVGTLVRLCLEAGASRVVVVDVPCNDAQATFTRSGIGLAAQQAGAQVILPGHRDFRTISLSGGVLQEWPVLAAVLDADRLINVPIVKHHSLTRLTAGMKNLYGIIGGRRNLLHQRIDQSLLDLGSFFRPTLVVVDAIRVLLRNGPTGGSLQDVQEVGQLAACTDPVAADAWAATFLGLPPAELGFLRLAHGVLGRYDLQRVREVT